MNTFKKWLDSFQLFNLRWENGKIVNTKIKEDLNNFCIECCLPDGKESDNVD